MRTTSSLLKRRPLALVSCALLTVLLCASHAASAAQAYRYYKFTQTALRGPTPNSVQMAELQVFDDNGEITAIGATNPGGSNPGTETPPNIIDNNLGTKWLDFNKLSII